MSDYDWLKKAKDDINKQKINMKSKLQESREEFKKEKARLAEERTKLQLDLKNEKERIANEDLKERIEDTVNSIIEHTTYIQGGLNNVLGRDMCKLILGEGIDLVKGMLANEKLLLAEYMKNFGCNGEQILKLTDLLGDRNKKAEARTYLISLL